MIFFYTAVIQKFLEYARKTSWGSEFLLWEKCDKDVLNLLRKYLKNSIMVIFYGASFQKFQKEFEFLCFTESNWGLLSQVFCVGKESIPRFCKEFSKLFWEYTHDHETFPIYRIELLLREFRKNIPASEFGFSIFDTSIIKPRYNKIERRQMDSTVFLRRERLVFYESEKELNINKLRTSSIANFTHALDAFILLELISRSSFSILTIHDSFGVSSHDANSLQNLLREIYEFVRQNGYRYFAEKMACMIRESCLGVDGEIASQKFLDFVLSSLPLGDESGQLEYSDLCEAQIIYAS